MSCHTDALLGGEEPTLEYGRSYTVKSVTCTDLNTGRCFEMSRDSYQLH